VVVLPLRDPPYGCTMTTKHRKIPSYRLHKPTGQAVVRLDGRDHYLGRHGTEASHEAYRRTIAEWLSRSASVTAPASARSDQLDLTVNELILAFWTRFAEGHYRRPDGTPTGELDNYRDSLRPLRRLYGSTPARDFGPLALKAVRQTMIDAGLARTTINQRIGRIVRLFKWAVENELVPPAVHQALGAVRGLQKGRSAAREPKPVRPAPEAGVEAVRPHVARQVWAMIELQRLTGMRPGEVCRMRGSDLDTSGPVWTYTPAVQKTEHHELERTIYLGPRAQAVLRPWLRPDASAYLFSPREAVEERLAERRRRRRTPMTPSQRARAKKRHPGRTPGEMYTPRTYHHAVRYGCDRAGVPAWHPNQLRHVAATETRKTQGLEAAQLLLGHRRADVTQLYAERDEAKAKEIAARYG
jgi:integrase